MIPRDALSAAAAQRAVLGLSLLANALTVRLLGAPRRRYEASTGGLVPFDLQSGLTADRIGTQLTALNDRAKRTYRLFFAADALHLVVTSWTLGLLTARVLRATPAPFARRLEQAGAPWLSFVLAAFDLAENVAFLVLVNRAPQASPGWARWGAALHRLKLGTLAATLGSMLGLGLTGMRIRVRPRRRTLLQPRIS